MFHSVLNTALMLSVTRLDLKMYGKFCFPVNLPKFGLNISFIFFSGRRGCLFLISSYKVPFQNILYLIPGILFCLTTTTLL